MVFPADFLDKNSMVLPVNNINGTKRINYPLKEGDNNSNKFKEMMEKEEKKIKKNKSKEDKKEELGEVHIIEPENIGTKIDIKG